MTEYFRGIKVGDRVWSVVYGWGEVVSTDCGNHWPIEVRFAVSGTVDQYDFCGICNVTELQTLFWSEVTITPPPKPKRMVRRAAQVRVCFDDGTKCLTVWGSEEQAHMPANAIHATLIWEEVEP